MLEVVPYGPYWRWQWISFCGRVLVDCGKEVYTCIGSAFDAARAYRIMFWAHADTIDHRQGRCV